MATGLSRVVATGILVLGVCAAVPFYRRTEERQEPPREPTQLTLQIPASQASSSLGVGRAIHDASPSDREPTTQAQPLQPAAIIGPPPDATPQTDPGCPSPEPPCRTTSAEATTRDAELAVAAEPLVAVGATGKDSSAACDRRAELKLAAIRHRIVDGDTLEQLSQRYLGCRERAAEIYEVNQSLLKSPDVLPIGVELTIPLGKTSEAENQGGPSSNTDTSPSGITDLVPLRRDELEELKSRSE